MKKQDHQVFKFTLIGSDAGKTQLLRSFFNLGFNNYEPRTIGKEFIKKQVEINGQKINLIINDTPGVERFFQILRNTYPNQDCLFVVYNIANKESFQRVNFWLKEIENMRSKDALIILIGNCLDLAERREVSFEEGEQFAKEHNLMFYEVSAKTGENVQTALMTATEAILQRSFVREQYPIQME